MPISAKKINESNTINGIDVPLLKESIEEVAENPSQGLTRWGVTTSWQGGTRTKTQVQGWEIGGRYLEKDFSIHTDEPLELGGTNQYANPQETLMAAFNACMTVGYAALCAMEGIQLEELRIETKGEIDLRGFFGLDPKIKPGYDTIQYTVHIKGDGTPEQFQKIHEMVKATSPNRFTIANPIKLDTSLVVA